MSKGDFADQLTAMVQSGALLTRRAETIIHWVAETDVTDADALAAIVKALAAGHLSEDDLRVLEERAPRFVEVLRAGLRPLLGPVTEARLVNLARHGHLNTSALHRALSNMRRPQAA